MVENTTRAFGCPLRYIQGYGEFSNLASYTAKFGRACFIIDGFLFEKLNERLKTVYKDGSGNFLSVCFKGECWDGEIERIAKIARGNGISVIVGVGGGKTLDTAKLCADELGLPVIIVPSSASNDAPVSEIAVLYTESGEYIGSRKLKRNAELVLVDSEIIAQSPRRLFIAGMGDASQLGLKPGQTKLPTLPITSVRDISAAKSAWPLQKHATRRSLMTVKKL